MSGLPIAVEPACAYYIRQVQWKLAAGEYQTEPAACFCGATDAILVTKKDRYGFDHAMWLCHICGVIYANPRMTEATASSFYENEYRQIYRTEHDAVEEEFAQCEQAARELKAELEEGYGLCPARVFDIGCNAGGWLVPFVEAGIEVHGVDYGPERVAYGQQRGMPIETGSIETLECLGLTADLIIMNHVLEHATNLRETLARVRGLLSDEGMLYVALPGLFDSDLQRVFQNAHPWQFTAETLTYVMESCGFEEVRADHTITSLWRKSETVKPALAHLPQAIRDIQLYLFQQGTRYFPKMRTICKFPVKERQASVRQAVGRGLPTCTELHQRHYGQVAVVLGGGPSIDAAVEQIRHFQYCEAIVLSIERMLPWCLQHGIRPDYVVTMDASDDVLEAFPVLPRGVQYIVSSQCKAEVFERLQGESVYLAHNSMHDLEPEELCDARGQFTLINGEGSVVLASLSLAMLMGMSRLHLFGFDCHISNGGYAQGIAGVGEQLDKLYIKIEDRSFITTTHYLAFAQQFFRLYDIAKRDDLLTSIKVYGDSLVNAMSVQNLRGDL